MTPFNWHEPLITPAQGVYIFAGCLGAYLAFLLFSWFLREPAVEVERFENVDAGER